MRIRFWRSGAALLLTAIGPACACASDGAATLRKLAADDFCRMQSVGDPQLSPDGQGVAYLVNTNAREADAAVKRARSPG